MTAVAGGDWDVVRALRRIVERRLHRMHLVRIHVQLVIGSILASSCALLPSDPLPPSDLIALYSSNDGRLEILAIPCEVDFVAVNLSADENIDFDLEDLPAASFGVVRLPLDAEALRNLGVRITPFDADPDAATPPITVHFAYSRGRVIDSQTFEQRPDHGMVIAFDDRSYRNHEMTLDAWLEDRATGCSISVAEAVDFIRAIDPSS